MPDYAPLYLYMMMDMQRKRHIFSNVCTHDDAMIECFIDEYRSIMRRYDWETRKLNRYFLFRDGVVKNGARHVADDDYKPELIFSDFEVPLSPDWFFWSDPPNSDEEWAKHNAEFERLDALDRARLLSLGKVPYVKPERIEGLGRAGNRGIVF